MRCQKIQIYVEIICGKRELGQDLYCDDEDGD